MILVDTECDADKTERYLKLSASDMQGNGQIFKSWFFCTVCLAFNSSARGLIETISLILKTDDAEDGHIAHMLGTSLYFSYTWSEIQLKYLESNAVEWMVILK